MSLYNVLRTGVSGMEAQSYKLATVGDNIANANTVGYKRADTEFSSLILEAGPGNYSSGAVTANVRYEISRQGALRLHLCRRTDLVRAGRALFFVVSKDDNGGNYHDARRLFRVDSQSGQRLVNAAPALSLPAASRPRAGRTSGDHPHDTPAAPSPSTSTT